MADQIWDRKKPISSSDPWTPEQLKVPPKQVAEYRAEVQRRGLSHLIKYDDNGRPRVESRTGANELLKMLNKQDNNAGYGDFGGS